MLSCGVVSWLFWGESMDSTPQVGPLSQALEPRIGPRKSAETRGIWSVSRLVFEEVSVRAVQWVYSSPHQVCAISEADRRTFWNKCKCSRVWLKWCMINFSAIPTQKAQTLRKKCGWCSVKLFSFLKPWLGNQHRLSVMVCWNEKVRGYFPGYFLYSKMK